MFDPTLMKIYPTFNIKLGKSRRIGILDKGEGTRVIGCEFENLDIAIQSEGRNLVAKRNKIK